MSIVKQSNGWCSEKPHRHKYKPGVSKINQINNSPLGNRKFVAVVQRFFIYISMCLYVFVCVCVCLCVFVCVCVCLRVYVLYNMKCKVRQLARGESAMDRTT